MAKVFNLSGDLTLEDVSFSTTAAKAQQRFDSAVSGIASSSTQMSKALDTSTASLTRFDRIAASMGTSTKALRGSIAGVGLQVQDLAVQIGSGQSALVALTQQLPQAAGAFGGVGAAIGTVVALAGAGYLAWQSYSGATKDAAEASKTFRAALDAANDTVLGSIGNVTDLRIEVDKLSESQRRSAALDIGEGFRKIGEEAKKVGDEVKEAIGSIFTVVDEIPGLPIAGIAKDLNEVSKTMVGLTEHMTTLDEMAEAILKAREALKASPNDADNNELADKLAEAAKKVEELQKAEGNLEEQRAALRGETIKGGDRAAAEEERKRNEAIEAGIRLERQALEDGKKRADQEVAALHAEVTAMKEVTKEKERLAKVESERLAKREKFVEGQQAELNYLNNLTEAYKNNVGAIREIEIAEKARIAVVNECNDVPPDTSIKALAEALRT